jgi:hypothetical protein
MSNLKFYEAAFNILSLRVPPAAARKRRKRGFSGTPRTPAEGFALCTPGRRGGSETPQNHGRRRILLHLQDIQK